MNRLFLILIALVMTGPAHAQIDARMLRYPDVSSTQVSFVYAGDIWVAPKDGGRAVRLSSPAGEETFPRFSPDGSLLAFSGNYDGNTDVYVISVDGGVPTRLTHHPMPDRVVDWHPDGQSVLFASSRESGKQRFSQFYLAPRSGGLAVKLPVPYGETGALSPDGRTLAYTPRWRDFRTWKRYRGGMNPDVWLFDLETFESRNVTGRPTNDAHPMWHGDTVYFLSDAGPEERHNLWAYDRTADALRQVTQFTDDDVRFPAIGPDDIVFENAGRLYLLALADESIREVELDVVTDLASLKPRIEDVASLVVGAGVSPTGKRAVFEARGEVFTVPAEHGVVRNLTQSSGVADRHPAWSPDGRWIAWFSDASGEYELTVIPADGSGEARTVTSLGPGFRYRPYWSPDSRKVAFIDQTMTIQVVTVETGEAVRVDQGLWMYQGALNSFSPSWSPDSRWLAYARGLENRHRAVFLFDIASGESRQVTSGYYSDSNPVFDPSGSYLYLTTDRTFEPEYSDLDNTWIYPNATNLAAIPLASDTVSPLLPRNDAEEATDSDEADDEEDANDEADDKATRIDLDGFEARLVVLPATAGNYTDLHAADGKLFFRRLPRTGTEDGADSPVVFYDVKAREEKTVLDDADGFSLSADGKKLLAAKDRVFAIVDAAPSQSMKTPLAVADLSMTVDPRAEWKQIFTDAWRFQRDMFYDRGMHGVDWTAMRTHYGQLLEDAVTRWDVDFVLGELIAELNASHTYKGGGDLEQAEQRGVGLLGVDWEVHDGAYRIARILDGGPHETEVRSPLNAPGIDVSEGDYVLAVNGRPLDSGSDPNAAFVGLGGKTVTLTVNDRPTTEGARQVIVEALSSETRLRNLAWIESNRRRVDEASGGRVGYIYVPSTGVDGQTELVRQFMAQFHKEALIIDERFNNGGQIPDRFVELLNRKPLAGWAVRDGKDWQWPPVAHFGPKSMLINGWSGSGGDAFPDYFRKAGLGPLIGAPTWGGLIGITGAPPLIDGGTVTVPTFRMFNPDGTWFAEGVGVMPDIEVVENPTQLARGIDPQIERAIAEMLRALDEQPAPMADRPPPEDRSGSRPVLVPPRG